MISRGVIVIDESLEVRDEADHALVSLVVQLCAWTVISHNPRIMRRRRALQLHRSYFHLRRVVVQVEVVLRNGDGVLRTRQPLGISLGCSAR